MIFKSDYTIQTSQGTIELLFNTWAIKQYCDTYSIEMEDLLGTLKLRKIPELLLVGNESYLLHNSKPFQATLMDACTWMDALGGMNGAELTKVIRLFMQKASGLSEAEFNKRLEVVATEEAPKKGRVKAA